MTRQIEATGCWAPCALIFGLTLNFGTLVLPDTISCMLTTVDLSYRDLDIQIFQTGFDYNANPQATWHIYNAKRLIEDVLST